MEENNKLVLRSEISRIDVAIFDEEVAGYCLQALRTHDCVVTISPGWYTLFLPKGTVQEEILPRTLDARYKILFPDGFEIQSVVRRGSDLHWLKMPRDTLPRHLQTRYR